MCVYISEKREGSQLMKSLIMYSTNACLHFLCCCPASAHLSRCFLGNPEISFCCSGRTETISARAPRFGSVNASTREKKCRNSKGENVGLSRDSDNISNSAFVTKSPP